ncbi:hypothetical protein [Streptomyces sp. NPDC002588]|uniref:hypothetical protein n=1 Tax=Streptomyces sp. NPDC002588 TaxID=3154419 RepID=UPI00331EA22C
MTDTEPCVSLTTGTLSPDLRVNYSYGMVLGLDEFLQEQLYRQEKDYRHRRLLHGYGTSYGLQLTTKPTTDGTQDYSIDVSPGAGIDQWGREFTVPDTQCVRLGSWLVAQEQAFPGIVQAHGNGSGDTLVYVVASYASCLDNLVPVPGQSCGTGEQSQVASRIRDSWTVELRWDPPPMPRWDSDRRLGRLLRSVGVVPQPDQSLPGEDALLAAVRALADQAENGPGDLDQFGPPPLAYEIAEWRAARLWDEIFAIWVSEVRPRLEPDLLTPSPSSDPSILLGGVQFSTGIWPPFDPADPRVTHAEIFDPGRPSVLSTQLIQELPPPDRVDLEPIELVTLVPNLTGSVFTIDAWFHVGAPVTLTAPVQVVTESGTTVAFTAVHKPMAGDSFNLGSVWTLTPPNGAKFTAGQQLGARFESDAVLVYGSSTLQQWRENVGGRFLNTTATGAVTAYTTALAPASTLTLTEESVADAAAVGTPIANAEFVTITDTGTTDRQLGFELWFHPEPRGARGGLTVLTPQVRAYDETTGDPLTVTALSQDPAYGNAWTVTTEVPGGARPFPAYVRFVFPAEGFVLTGPESGESGLADLVDGGGVQFTGWDRDTAGIVAFHRVGSPEGGGAEPAPAARKTTTGRSQKR